MKIVMLGPYPLDENYTRGGVEKVTFNTVLGLKERDELELHVVSPSYLVDQDTRRTTDGVVIHHLRRQRRLCLPTFHAGTVRRTRQYLRRLAPDLIHCQESGLESFIAAGTGLPVVVTLHAVFKNEAKYYPGPTARVRYWQIGLLARLAERRVSRYIASSRYVHEEMQRLRQKVHGVVENPIEQRYFEIPEAPVDGRILFAGTMYPRKGVHDLVAAAVRLGERGVDFTLHIAGQPHSQDYLAQVRDIVATGHVAERVVFRGLLSEDDLSREFAEASIVVLPSYAETSPMFIQQAMAAGKAIVATRVGGLPYLIADGESGLLVDPGDVGALAASLERLLGQPALRARCGVRARAEALARFSPAEVAARSVAVYREVLGQT
jgi:glycosyltransferase involved in cell wall biosynthesis